MRGSALLLVGRCLSVGLNFGVQVFTVRYLAKADYGAFAYALGVVALGTGLALMGLGKALPRLVPIYEERGDPGRAVGSVVLGIASIVGVGIAIVLAVIAMQGLIHRQLVDDERAMSLLLVLIAVAPLDALDYLLQQLLAYFAGAWAVVARRHLLGPGLKLAAVLAVTWAHGSVLALAWAYLIAGAIGVSVSLALLARSWARRGLLRYIAPSRLILPVREVFGLSLPLLASDYAAALRTSIAVIALEYLGTTTAVADYRAVLPLAGLNMFVFDAFGFLFVPLGSRMFARRQHQAINELYWRSCTWIAVLTFPVFALTSALAEPIAVRTLGEAYAGTGVLLAVLSVGFYVNAALGFNAATLRVHGKTKVIIACDLLALAGCVVLHVVLIGRFGALGAALATTGTQVLWNVLNQAGLLAARTGVQLLDRRFAGVYLAILIVAASLLGCSWAFDPPLALSIALIGGLSVAVFRLARAPLDPATSFPELARMPVLGRLFTGS